MHPKKNLFSPFLCFHHTENPFLYCSFDSDVQDLQKKLVLRFRQGIFFSGMGFLLQELQQLKGGKLLARFFQKKREKRKKEGKKSVKNSQIVWEKGKNFQHHPNPVPQPAPYPYPPYPPYPNPPYPKPP